MPGVLSINWMISLVKHQMAGVPLLFKEELGNKVVVLAYGSFPSSMHKMHLVHWIASYNTC